MIERRKHNKKFNFFSILFIFGILLLSGCETHIQNNQSVEENISEEGMIIQEAFEEIEEEFTLPILGYHHVGLAPTHLSASAKQWYVSKDSFISALDYIQKNNFTPIRSSDKLPLTLELTFSKYCNQNDTFSLPH